MVYDITNSTMAQQQKNDVFCVVCVKVLQVVMSVTRVEAG
jgi:hypothetical protein